MASTMGTARGRTQGSWRPSASRVTAAPARSTVCWAQADGGRRLEGDAQQDRLAVRDAALHAARAVARGARPASLAGHERIVVLASGEARAGEAAADLEALRGRQREHALREIGLELVEHRLAESRRHAPRQARHDAAEGVAAPPRGVDALLHARRGLGVGAAHGVRLDLGQGDGVGVDLGVDVVHLRHPREHLDPTGRAQQLARHGARRDAAHGLPGARPPAALPVPDAVLRLGGEVGVGRAVDVLHRFVRRRARVLVAHQERDRRAEGPALEEAREDLDPVGLLARRGEPALARPAPIEIALDLLRGELEARRAAVHHDAHAAAVGLAEGRDPEDDTELARHGGLG